MGLNQTDMASKCDLSPTMIVLFENSRLASPSPRTRRKLAAGYGIDIADIPGKRPDAAPVTS